MLYLQEFSKKKRRKKFVLTICHTYENSKNYPHGKPEFPRKNTSQKSEDQTAKEHRESQVFGQSLET